MATTNNVRVNNFLPVSVTSGFNMFWRMTRSMKKAGWKFKASSNGTTKISNSDPAADNWGSGTVTNAGAAAASIGTPSRGRASVTGLTGIVAADKGKFLTITGAATGANNNHHQIEEIVSATEVKIDARNFAVGSDANNGALTWTVRDPEGDVYSTFTAALDANTAWWVGMGPSVLQIPITSASTGTFIRGENITQATTGAQGELLGYVFLSGTGYLVVAPRLRGTGAGVYGWDTALVVTGSTSAATVTQVGTAKDFSYEVCIIKPANDTTIQVLIGQFDTSVAGATELPFSFCATQAAATATVAPAGGGTNNTLSAYAWVLWGTSNVAGGGTFINTDTVNTDQNFVLSHVLCVDCIPELNYSADGSWSLVFSYTASVATAPVGYNLYGFHRLNDMEDGDLSPYVSINPGGTKTLYGNTRTSAGTAIVTPTPDQWNTAAFVAATTTRVWFQGWRRRGLTLDAFVELESTFVSGGQTAGAVLSQNTLEAFKVATSPAAYTKLREPIWIVSSKLGAKFYKGTLRWMYWISGDQVTDVYGTDPAWVQLSSVATPAVIGPSDGTAWQLNT